MLLWKLFDRHECWRLPFWHTHNPSRGESEENFLYWIQYLQAERMKEGQKGGRSGRFFCLFSFSHFYTIWSVNTLGSRADWSSCQSRRHINASFSFFLSVGKVEINQCDRVKGIRRRWEVEITCYYPFGKLQQSDINIIHKAFCWVYPLSSSLCLTLHLCHVTILSVSLICMFPCTL